VEQAALFDTSVRQLCSLALGDVKMARSNGNAKNEADAKPRFEDFKFVNSRLTEREKTAFETWKKAHSDDAFILLNEVVNSGKKFTASWDGTNDCYIVSFTCLEKRSPNYCLVLSSRSDDLWDAICMNLFKDYDLFRGEWPTETKANWG